jgi:dTMP kinase
MTQILKSGKNLILDRYTESNVAHQGAKIGIKDPRFTKFEEFIYQLEYKTLELRIPDIFFLLHMPWNIAIEQRKNRVGVADIIEADIENLKRAEEVYLYLAEKWEWKKIDCAPDGTVKSKKYPKQIHEEIYSYVKKILN